MKKAKISQKRIIAMLKMLLYSKTQHVNQWEALDKSAGYLTLIDYHLRLFAPNKGRILDRGDIK